MVSSLLFTTLFASILLTASSIVNAQNVIGIDVPQVNSNIISKGLVNVTYTVIGSQAANPQFNVNTTYPDSLSIDFVWTEHANASNVISLSAATGLNTDSHPGGLQNVQHKTSWSAPNCHFFSRYPPTTFDFSLVFTPVYPNPTSSQDSIVGTEQSAIVVPVAVTVDNSTFPKC